MSGRSAASSDLQLTRGHEHPALTKEMEPRLTSRGAAGRPDLCYKKESSGHPCSWTDSYRKPRDSQQAVCIHLNLCFSSSPAPHTTHALPSTGTLLLLRARGLKKSCCRNPAVEQTSAANEGAASSPQLEEHGAAPDPGQRRELPKQRRGETITSARWRKRAGCQGKATRGGFQGALLLCRAEPQPSGPGQQQLYHLQAPLRLKSKPNDATAPSQPCAEAKKKKEN